MSLTFSQASVGTVATSIIIIPPGSCNVTITNSGTTNAGFLSSGSSGSANASSSNGYALGTGSSVTFFTYPGSAGEQIWATGAGSPATFKWVVSTAS